MKTRTLSLLILLVLFGSYSHFVNAQTQANDWINPAQSYLKVPIAENGIYKISFEDLQAAGWPVTAINPRSLQLFHRGQEQAIYVAGETNAAFEPGEYLLFYGRRNDGTLDRQLYKSPEAQPHPYYNLYSDTTAYFLTYTLDNSPGRRMSSYSASNTENLPAETAYIREVYQLFSGNYSPGLAYPFAGEYQTYSSYGDFGEGFTSAVIANGSSRDFTFENLGTLVSGPMPELEVVLSGRNNIARDVSLYAGNSAGSLTQLGTASFSGATHYKNTYGLTPGMLSGGNFVFRVSTSSGERVSVAALVLRYPQAVAMGGEPEKMMILPGDGAQTQKYLSIPDLPAGAWLLDVSNPGAPLRIGMPEPGKALIPNAATDRKLWISTQFKTPVRLKRVTFRSLPASVSYLMVSHPSLRQPTENYTDPVKAYAEFRASAAGGSYDTLLMNVQEVYDYFSYGEISPLGIRNLVRYYVSRSKPAYLFLIGKALTPNYNYYRQTDWPHEDRDLVPSFGFPGADLPFVAQLDGRGEAPAMAVGRLTARHPDEVAAYLKKVKETEALSGEDISFRKDIVHLSGGTSASEAYAMRTYLRSYEDVAEGLYAGAQVQTFSKSEDVIVQEINISEAVNKGLGLITFFGHSGPAVTDIEIGYVSDDQNGYHNQGKYPCILVNGCSAGNIFSRLDIITFGEDWILTPNRGALNFIAHSGIGYTNFLRSYSSHFYERAYTDTLRIQASTGSIVQQTVEKFLQEYGESDLVVAQAHQVVLQGDPAVRLFNLPLPNYALQDNSLSLRPAEGQPLTLNSDSIALDFAVKNLGSARPDSVWVRLEASLEGGANSLLWEGLHPAVYYQDTSTLWFASKLLPGAGLTRFTLHFNADRRLEEPNYLNNQASFDFVIKQGGASPLLPTRFALQPDEQVKFYVQTLNPFSEGRRVRLELDTVPNFSSGALRTDNLAVLGLGLWQPELPALALDTVTYFWRTRLEDPQPEEDSSWVHSSFTRIRNAQLGWMQRHVAQYKANEFKGLEIDASGRFVFPQIERKIELKVYGADHPEMEQPAELIIDGISYLRVLEVQDPRQICRTNSINALQFDRENLELLIAKYQSPIDPRGCGILPQIVNNFVSADVVNGNNDEYNLEAYLGSVEEGNWVVLFTIGKNDYSLWPASLRNQFASFGVDPALFGSVLDGEPLIIRMRKGGDATDVKIFRADPNSGMSPTEQALHVQDVIEGRTRQGTMLSTLIGPARNWGQAQFSVQAQPEDEYAVQLIALDANRNAINWLTLTDAQPADLSQLDAASYPFLQMQLFVRDAQNQTPAQLRHWQVSYTPLPEGVLLPSAQTTFPLSKFEGESVEAGFRYLNISDQPYASDSLLVRESFLNLNNQKETVRTHKIPAPLPGDTVAFTVTFNTDAQGGTHALNLGVNQDLSQERIVSNNSLNIRPFVEVRVDSIQPVLDVAFDGVYIANGAIVSPDPLISIILRDENPYLSKQDTVGLNLSLKPPCEGCDFQRVNLAGEKVEYKPASGEEPFQLNYRPGPLADGLYTLQVQAADASGNKAGNKPYEVSFEVVNEASITHFYPYPNPFSTSTRFVFTLTGSKVPDNMKIQIMTQSGRVVREILKEELGTIRIGHNISQYAWDGRDEWGDQLANGIYFYRVLIQDSEYGFEHRDTNADKAFHKGLGKLYLLR